jgi:hypothetical protein
MEEDIDDELNIFMYLIFFATILFLTVCCLGCCYCCFLLINACKINRQTLYSSKYIKSFVPQKLSVKFVLFSAPVVITEQSFEPANRQGSYPVNTQTCLPMQMSNQNQLPYPPAQSNLPYPPASSHVTNQSINFIPSNRPDSQMDPPTYDQAVKQNKMLQQSPYKPNYSG